MTSFVDISSNLRVGIATRMQAEKIVIVSVKMEMVSGDDTLQVIKYLNESEIKSLYRTLKSIIDKNELPGLP